MTYGNEPRVPLDGPEWQPLPRNEGPPPDATQYSPALHLASGRAIHLAPMTLAEVHSIAAAVQLAKNNQSPRPAWLTIQGEAMPGGFVDPLAVEAITWARRTW